MLSNPLVHPIRCSKQFPINTLGNGIDNKSDKEEDLVGAGNNKTILKNRAIFLPLDLLGDFSQTYP